MELSHSPRTQATDNTPKTQSTSFFPLWKLKGNQPAPKVPILQLVHLEEDGARRNEDEGSKSSDGINGVTEEFMVHLARAVKDAQTDEKHCYHCSSLEHFIHNCLLMKTLREKLQLNGKKGMAMKKGAQTPLQQPPCQRISRWRFPRHKATPTDSLLESRPLSTLAWG